jgi:hypothetical protein
MVTSRTAMQRDHRRSLDHPDAVADKLGSTTSKNNRPPSISIRIAMSWRTQIIA